VEDDGELLDLQIVFTLGIAYLNYLAHNDNIKFPDAAILYAMLWKDDIDMSFVGPLIN
jgi:hypothetical protein